MREILSGTSGKHSPQPTLHRVLAGTLPDAIEPRSEPPHANRVRHLRLAHPHGQLGGWTKRRFRESTAPEDGQCEHGGFVQR